MKIFAAVALLISSTQGLGRFWGDLRPRSYKKGDVLDIKVGRLWSAVAATMPYDFYSLNWCDSTAGHSWDGGHKRQKK